MSAKVLDGTGLAAEVAYRVLSAVTSRVAQGKSRPGLAVVLIGEDPASQVYVRNKRRTSEKAGIRSFMFDLPLTTTEHELLTLVDELNANPEISGILVQLPLPRHINADRVVERISPLKDVDGFHPYNVGRLALKMPLFRPCTPQGCMQLLKETQVDLVGKHAVIIGQSNIVGRPMAFELLMSRCTVTICHSATRDLPALVRQADIVVAAVGKPEFVRGDWLKQGSIVVDVGINRTSTGQLCGDVEFASACERAEWVTPVPGGVGPMTIAMLLVNTLEACELQDTSEFELDALEKV